MPSLPQQASQCEGKWKDSSSPPSASPACPIGTSRTLGLVSCHRGWVLQAPNAQASPPFPGQASILPAAPTQAANAPTPQGRRRGGPSSTARTSSCGARNCKTSGSDESQGRERVRKPARGGENPCILGIIPAASTLTSFLCFSH